MNGWMDGWTNEQRNKWMKISSKEMDDLIDPPEIPGSIDLKYAHHK